MHRSSAVCQASALILAAFILAGAGPAIACPSCETGQAARAEVFGPGFWTQLFLVVLPLLVAVVVSALLYRIGIRRTVLDSRLSRR